MNDYRRLLDQGIHHIQENALIGKEDTIVAGVSGGADSIFLLNLLIEAKDSIPFSLVVAHMDHGLRTQSSRDLTFVRSVCRDRGIPFHGSTTRVGSDHGDKHMSVEMAARNMRMRFLESVAHAHGADRIALGHNMTDNVETMLMHIHRGSGIRGLSGIHLSRGKIIRPLLIFTGRDIRDVLTKAGIKFVEDGTNNQNCFLRNRVRQTLLPALESSFGANYGVMWSRVSGHVIEGLEAIRYLIAEWLGPHMMEDDAGFRIKRDGLREIPESVRKEILLFLIEKLTGSTYHVTSSGLDLVSSFCQHDGFGMIEPFRTRSFKVIRSSNWIYFLADNPGEITWNIPGPGSYRSWFGEVLQVEETKEQPTHKSDSHGTVILDPSKSPFPWQWMPIDCDRDTLVRGEKTVRDINKFLKKNGIGFFERRHMPVLKRGGQILWIPGIPLERDGNTPMGCDKAIRVYIASVIS